MSPTLTNMHTNIFICRSSLIKAFKLKYVCHVRYGGYLIIMDIFYRMATPEQTV